MTLSLADYMSITRYEAGLSQGDVATALGFTSPQFISNWERGVSKIPLMRVRAYCEITNSSVSKLKDRMLMEFKKELRLI